VNIRLPLVLALALASASLIMPVAAQAQIAPLPPEKHPPGDIPDSQVFVVHRSPLGFTLKVPEGWARRVTPDGVSFSSTYDGIAVGVSSAATAPSVASVKREQALALQNSPAAVRIAKIAAVRLPAGPAVWISYSSNSEPNPVTGKAIRLENEQYLFWKDGKLATLTLYAPYGADNVDQWRLMSRSFRWR
jgi:hypothetical protein